MAGKYSTGFALRAIQNEAYWIKIVDNSTRALQVQICGFFNHYNIALHKK